MLPKPTTAVEIGPIRVGGNAPLALIAGPCVVESPELTVQIARTLRDVCAELQVPLVFKASYDKANKTVAGSPRGPGWQRGLDILAKVKADVGVPILTDVHDPCQCGPVAEVCDVLQIPALLSKQIDLILAAAETGRPLNIKKGQWTAPWEMINVLSRLRENGYTQTMVTERGTTFGYGLLVNDFRGLVVMQALGQPVIYDASHSVAGASTIGEGVGGNREFIPYLSRAAVACGVDALFIEVHPDPDRALSDAQSTFPLGGMRGLLKSLLPIAASVRSITG